MMCINCFRKQIYLKVNIIHTIMPKQNYKEIGNKYYKKEQYALASGFYKKYVAEPHEDNKAAYSNLSLCYFKLKKYQSCIDACNSALELDPKYPKVLYRKTLAYELLGETLGIYRSAKAYCDLCKDQKDGEWDKMRKMADDAEIAIAHVHPENVKDKFKFLIVSPQADKDSKTQIPEINEQLLNNCLKNNHFREALNICYFLRNKATKKAEKERLSAKIKEVSARMKGIQVEKPVQVEQEKQTKTESVVEQKEQSSDLYEKYFQSPLTKNGDIFEGFFIVAQEILMNKELDHLKLSNVLNEIVNKYEMFSALQMSLSQKQKNRLKQLFEEREIEEELGIKFYL